MGHDGIACTHSTPARPVLSTPPRAPHRTPPPPHPHNSWQIHSYFCRGDGDSGLTYGLLNFVTGEEVHKYAIVPVDSKINFRHLLELMNLYEYRVKKLCTFVATEQKEREHDFSRDFPDSAPPEDLSSLDLAEYAAVVQSMSTALRSLGGGAVTGDSIFDVLSTALLSRDLLLLRGDYILDVLMKMAAADGFVFLRPQAVNKKVVLDLLLGKGSSFFLMARSSPPVDYIYDMVKLCLKAARRGNGGCQTPTRSPRMTQDNMFLCPPSISPVKRNHSIFNDIEFLEDPARPICLSFPMSPSLATDSDSDTSDGTGGVPPPKKDKQRSPTRSLVLVLIAVIILSVIYYLLITTQASSGFFVFEVLAVSALLPALLCYRVLFAIPTDLATVA